jgi:hypothetical protein
MPHHSRGRPPLADRYRVVPGDDLPAATRPLRLPPSGALNGTGDGVISGRYMRTIADLVAAPPTTATRESNNFRWHLRLASFVLGATPGAAAWSQPVNAAGGYVGVQNESPGINAEAPGLSALVLCSANVPDKVASTVDTQVDHQRSFTGQLIAYSQGTSSNPPWVVDAPVPP